MPPARAPSLWEHAELDLRLYRSGHYFYVSGHDGSKRIQEKLTRLASSETILLKLVISDNDAADIVAAINRGLGMIKPRDPSALHP